MRITIIDVAKKLNVDPSTVSLALRNSPKISKKTTALVKKTATQMGYKTNPYISALMSAQRQGKLPTSKPTIAFITSSRTAHCWKDKPITFEFYSGCEDKAQALGVNIELFWLGAADMTAHRMHDILYSRGIRGAILLPTGKFRSKFNHSWEELAVVSYGIYTVSPEIDRVISDHYGNMEITLKKLQKHGFKRIGFAMDTPYPYSNDNRWLAAYIMYEQKTDKSARIPAFLVEEPNNALFNNWYQTHQPEVIICVQAPKVIDWLKSAQKHVPRDVSVVTLSDLNPKNTISGIVENAYDYGKLAMQTVLNRIYHNEFGPQKHPHQSTMRSLWREGTTLALAKK